MSPRLPSLFLSLTALAGAAPSVPVALPVPAAEILSLPVMEPPKSDFKRGEWVFDPVPRALQRNPKFEMSIRCRVTPFGESYLAASPEEPVYYLIQDMGQRQLGDPVGGEAPPENLDKFLVRALSTNGYLPATETSPRPELVLTYFWGSSYAMDLETRLKFPELHYRQRMERARLVGDSVVRKQYSMGGSMDEGPYHQEQNSLFFAVVSAYDHDSVAAGKPELVWRAHLTVNAVGVSMSEALPALVLTAGTSFGHDTKGAHFITRRAVRGKVELAPLVILPGDVAATPPR